MLILVVLQKEVIYLIKVFGIQTPGAFTVKEPVLIIQLK